MNRPKEDFPVWSITPRHLYLCDNSSPSYLTFHAWCYLMGQKRTSFALHLLLIIHIFHKNYDPFVLSFVHKSFLGASKLQLMISYSLLWVDNSKKELLTHFAVTPDPAFYGISLQFWVPLKKLVNPIASTFNKTYTFKIRSAFTCFSKIP